ncbi:hypothetical protein DPMN_178916 [Dreissena polymorpha]|uniref:Uncharacterized protein n=1 Tax=Dreissena polymorpha TaxID=45954 RepID=A0A9D4ILN1_DREPO|nr:hypothetical protein DPMN_178916 [Dreissena polymorpha]
MLVIPTRMGDNLCSFEKAHEEIELKVKTITRPPGRHGSRPPGKHGSRPPGRHGSRPPVLTKVHEDWTKIETSRYQFRTCMIWTNFLTKFHEDRTRNAASSVDRISP